MNTENPSKRRSTVRAVADALRLDVIDRAHGDLVGSEDDLIERYGVSRPTLRQAAALISQEQLLEVRRGVGGGYFACRPNSRAVAHVAAVYLRSRRTRLVEILQAVQPIRVELAKLAARSRNQEARQRLRQFLEHEQRVDEAQIRYKDFVRAEREFGRLLGELSGNHVIALFFEILYDFSSMLRGTDDLYHDHPERVIETRSKRNRLAAAILEGDEEIAVVAAKRCSLGVVEEMIAGMATDTRDSDYFQLEDGEPIHTGISPHTA